MHANVLEAHPTAKLSVLAVWMPMLVTDSRGAWSGSILPDRRVRSFWDEDRVAGQWFADEDLGGLGYSGIVWDAYYLYGPSASWDDTPTGLVGSGSTLIGTSDQLRSQIEPLLADRPA